MNYTTGIDVSQADTDTLERWLRNNAMNISDHEPGSAELDLCIIHLRRIAAELIKRKG